MAGPVTDSPPSRESSSERLPIERIFRDHVSYVVHSLRRLGVREADVEDVAHEVFLVVHRRYADFDETRPIKPWLFGIAVRCAASFRRRASVRHKRSDATLDETRALAGADEAPADAERRALVHRALESVHESRRPVLILHDLDGESMPAIAAELGIPLNTGYSRLRLARAEMREALLALSRGELP